MSSEPTVTLPDGKVLSVVEATDRVKQYNPAVFDLYDRPSSGPHDELLAIDVLSLNALNAFGPGAPMTAMTAVWEKRDDINELAAGITKKNLELLTASEIDEALPRLDEALEYIDAVRGFGYTSTSKLLHRLRPNITPIWDSRIQNWYHNYARDKTWTPWLRQVFQDVLKNRHCLETIRADLRLDFLPIVRIWDILLWSPDA